MCFSQACFADEQIEDGFETTKWNTYVRYVSTNKSLTYVLIFILIIYAVEVIILIIIHLCMYLNQFILLNSDLPKKNLITHHQLAVGNSDVVLNITFGCGCLDFVDCIESEKFENQSNCALYS